MKLWKLCLEFIKHYIEMYEGKGINDGMWLIPLAL